MHVRIRNLSSTTNGNDLVLKVSKTTLIKELQSTIRTKLGVKQNQQKLYYRGKQVITIKFKIIKLQSLFFQLIPDHTINDYDIKLNDVIQMYVKNNEKENYSPNIDKNLEKIEAKSFYYERGDKIDVVDNDNGAWFEAKVINIFTTEKTQLDENNLIFQVQMDRYKHYKLC